MYHNLVGFFSHQYSTQEEYPIARWINTYYILGGAFVLSVFLYLLRLHVLNALNAQPGIGHEPSAVNVLLKQTQRWLSAAQVFQFGKFVGKLPFDDGKPEFLAELLPFHNATAYNQLTSAEKKRILTYAWILYNQKTLVIELDIVNPVCALLAKEKAFGLIDHSLSVDALQTMSDESFHSLLVNHGIAMTEHRTNISLPPQKFHLIKSMNEKMEEYQEEWKRRLVLMATSIVSELFISDYLRFMSESIEVQAINREIVKAHRIDEERHGKIFMQFAIRLYKRLDQEQREFFCDMLKEPVRWFANKDLTIWKEILAKELGEKIADKILTETAPERYFLDCIDYSKIDDLRTTLQHMATVNREYCVASQSCSP